MADWSGQGGWWARQRGGPGYRSPHRGYAADYDQGVRYGPARGHYDAAYRGRGRYDREYDAHARYDDGRYRDEPPRFRDLERRYLRARRFGAFPPVRWGRGGRGDSPLA
jgi:hypothetical protein